MGSQHAARFTSHYTAAEREAFLKAHLVDGLSVREAMRRARAGLLGVPSFGSRSGNDNYWGYSLIKQHRDAFEAKNDDVLADATDAELRKHHKLCLDALRELPADADPAERARRMKALADAAKARGQAPKRKPAAKPPAEAGPDKTEQPDSPLPELLAMAQNAEGPHDGGPSNGAAAAG